MCGLLACVVIGLSCVVGFNLTVDPHDRHGAPLGKVDQQDPSAIKLLAIHRAPRFDTLILGDSRGQRAEPAYLRRRRGWSVFNASVTAGRGSVALTLLRAGLANQPLRRVLILAGPEALVSDSIADRIVGLRVDRTLGDRLRRLLSLDEVQRSFRVLREAVGLGAQRPLWTYDARGLELTTDAWNFDVVERAGGPREPAIANTLNIFGNTWAAGPGGPNEHDLVRAITLARSQGATVTFVALPYERETWRRAGGPLRDSLREALRIVRDAGATAVDLSRLPVPRRYFADGVHLSNKGMRQVLDAVLRETGT